MATALVMMFAARVTRAVPAVILGLGAGILTYFALGIADKSLLALAGNTLVVGPLGDASSGLFDGMRSLWHSFGQSGLPPLGQLLVPALTLAVLLSIDTLKTCLIVDSLTRNRHDSNRELIAQGLGNIAANAMGGISGAGIMGPTLVNISSGAQTRRSSLAEGTLALAAFLLLGSLVAWVPVAALAAILIVIGVRMFDRNSLQLLRSRATVLDFAVIVTVVIVAETVSLIAASAAGVGLAIILFIREQIRGSSVRRLTYGNQMFSKQVRLPEQRAILEQHGGDTAIVELQGSLFFGNTDALYRVLEPEIAARKYLILDMRRVSTVDVTAAHMIGQIEDRLHERDAFLLFSGLARNLAGGIDMQRYFDDAGLVRPEHHARLFGERDDALQWVEDRIIDEARITPARQTPLELREIALFIGRKDETLAALAQHLRQRAFKAGEAIFNLGDAGDELLLIRSGTVRIELPLAGGQRRHISSFGRGDFFGEMAFLDNQPRSANAVASDDTELFVLSRRDFDALVHEHRMLVINLLEGLAKVLADRLRHANIELRLLHES
jgi:SulP family sulfate permease